MNIKSYLNSIIEENNWDDLNKVKPYLIDKEIDTTKIKCIMINEVVASDINEDFYSSSDHSDYFFSLKALFNEAGYSINHMDDLIERGIYVTNAVKYPKSESTIPRSEILLHAKLLEKELLLFENLKIIMIMGDVAKVAFNSITKKATKKNAIPNISTYKLRTTPLYYDEKRIFPSYIMTGKNLMIEKSKVTMISEDLIEMMTLLSDEL